MLEGVETYGGRVKVCGRGGGVWERWRCVVGGVEVCGRGGGECGMGGDVWEGARCVGGVEMCGKE